VLTGGVSGIAMAMGVTFISLQGFEMVSAIAGEIKDPQRTIPRAIFLSLAISFAVYMPLFFLVATAGVDGGHVMALAEASPETVVAAAAGEWLGAVGYWVIVVAITLATLSALQANLLTASRISFAMAHDHTLLGHGARASDLAAGSGKQDLHAPRIFAYRALRFADGRSLACRNACQ